MILFQKNVVRTQKSFRITNMQTFGTQEKAKPDKENGRGLKLTAALKLTAVEMTKLPLRHKLNRIRHNLLHKARTNRGDVYTANM
jgi:hypothetical protein